MINPNFKDIYIYIWIDVCYIESIARHPLIVIGSTSIERLVVYVFAISSGSWAGCFFLTLVQASFR